MASNSLQELVNETELYLSRSDDSFTDAPALCASLLARLNTAVPDVEFSDRHLRMLRSRLRVRQNQLASNTSGERSDQGTEDPSSSFVEPSTDPPAYQEITSDITLLRAKLDAIRQQQRSPPPLSPASGMSEGIQKQISATDSPPSSHPPCYNVRRHTAG